MTTVDWLSRVGYESIDWILDADLEMLITDFVSIIQANPASSDYDDERDGAN